MEVLYLKSLDRKLPHELISDIANVSQNTMLSYFIDYQTGGIEKLKEVKFYRPQSKLEEHKQTIEQYFLENPPASLSEASAKIEELTGIKRGLTQTAKFIKKLGMKLRKVGSIPGKAITENIFCRCCSFRIRWIFRMFVVFFSFVFTNANRPTTI